MKAMKTVALVTAVLVMTMFTACDIGGDVTDADKIAQDRDLTWETRTLGNSYGGNDAFSGIDLVNDTAFNATVDKNTGIPEYADSSLIDLRTINSNNRATTLTSRFFSLNGAKFAKASLENFKRYSKRQLMNAGDDALLDTIDLADCIDADDTLGYSYFVGKLGPKSAMDTTSRGYVLARATYDLDSIIEGGSATNTGFIELEYVLLNKVAEIDSVDVE